MDDDHTLLSRFAKAKVERVFTELVRQVINSELPFLCQATPSPSGLLMTTWVRM
jgi:hypothetical protein